MAHIHDVKSSDFHFILNPITRSFSNVNEAKNLIAQGDHYSERFTFEMPRYVEGHDMLTCNKVEIHYINVNTTTRESVGDVYIVDDMQAKDDGNDITFSWLLSRNATKYDGKLNFMVKFKCISDVEVDYQWSSLIYQKIQVGASYDNSESVIEIYSDVLEQWKKEIIESLDIDVDLNDYYKKTETYSKVEIDTKTSELSREIEELKQNSGGEVEILPRTDFEFAPIPDAPLSLYMSMPTLGENPTFTFGQTYTIKWDNIEYQHICKDIEGVHCLGNTALGGMGEDTGESFLIVYDVANEQFMIVTSEQGETHNIGIYQSVSYCTEAQVRTIVDEIINEALNSEV